MNDNASKFRILSLDGGGVRGILSAQILSNMESYLNRFHGEDIPVGQRFDFIAGTSTSGLIALGLAAGKSASEILEFYRQVIPEVFSKKI